MADIPFTDSLAVPIVRDNVPLVRVSDLNPSVLPCKIRIRVLRRFKCSSIFDDTLQLILVDTEGHKIHAIIRRGILGRGGFKFFQGRWFILRDFDLHPSDGPFRPTLHALTLHWNMATTATQIPSLGSDDYFNFVSFTDIKGLMLDRNFCYDLIGRIVRVGNFEDGEPINNVWNQIYVELEDESGVHLQCRLPSGYCRKLLRAWEKPRDDPTILIMRFARLEVTRDGLRATTACNCTRIMLDRPCSEVVAMKQLFRAKDRRNV